MADTSKKTIKKSGDKSSTTVTRITATDSRPSKKAVSSTTEPKAKKKVTSAKATSTATPAKEGGKNPLRGLAGYFAGAWHELRQVRWPNRKATWQLTVAVLIFTAFFAVLVLLLDTLFKFLFEQVLA